MSSPVGQYKPEVLVLAPEENPDDANLLSLVSQLLEQGIALELDENWNVPTRPPKDLSAYKCCIFPETTKAQYDKDLDAYYRGGGFLTFDKYYPTAAQQIPRAGFTASTAAYLNVAWGRDLYFYSIANYLYEAGVTHHHSDFRRTLEGRPTRALLDEVRGTFVKKARSHTGPWRDWGDPAWTTFLATMAASRVLRDNEYSDALDLCLRCVCEAADEALGDPLRFQELPIAGAANNSFDNMGHALMKRGTLTGNKTFTDTGSRLGQYFFDQVYASRDDHVISDRNAALIYSESVNSIPCLCWLTRLTGNPKPLETACRVARIVVEKTQRPDGLWHHFHSYANGDKGSCWSRAQLWPTVAMTESLAAMGADAPALQFMRDSARRTFDALARFQDPDWGLWHLVADESDSRIESTAAAGLVYCHDRLREMDVLDDRYEGMCARVLSGLKRLYYRGGLCATCRGTACGDANFYRSRPQGYQSRTHHPAVLAQRKDL